MLLQSPNFKLKLQKPSNRSASSNQIESEAAAANEHKSSQNQLSSILNPRNSKPNIMVPKQDDTLGEKMQKVEFRTLERSNTRLNINNVNLAQKKENRERALNYWKDRVIQDFLPPINETRKRNVNATDKSNTVENPTVSKVVEYKMVKTVAHM